MTDTHTTAHIPDEAVQAALDKWFSARHRPKTSPEDDMRDAIIAALPHLSAPCAVEVVKLDWQEPTKETNGCWTAKCLIGTYSVVNENGWYVVLDEHAWGVEGFEWSSTDLSKDTRQTAYDAAQSDFERRVLSNVVAKPVDVAAVREALNETRIDLVILRGNVADAAKTDSRWEGMPDRVQSWIDRIDMALALSAEPAQGDQWSTITRSQLNGDEFLTWNGRRQHVARFDKVDNAWVSSFTTVTKRLPISPQPTHFSPLPAAPTSEAGK